MYSPFNAYKKTGQVCALFECELVPDVCNLGLNNKIISDATGAYDNRKKALKDHETFPLAIVLFKGDEVRGNELDDALPKLPAEIKRVMLSGVRCPVIIIPKNITELFLDHCYTEVVLESSLTHLCINNTASNMPVFVDVSKMTSLTHLRIHGSHSSSKNHLSLPKNVEVVELSRHDSTVKLDGCKPLIRIKDCPSVEEQRNELVAAGAKVVVRKGSTVRHNVPFDEEVRTNSNPFNDVAM